MLVLPVSEKYRRYGSRANAYDLLKFLALITMTIDHFGMYWYPDDLWLRVIGRVTFPIYFFLIGYSGSVAIRRDLIAIAVIYTLINAAAFAPFFPLNALFGVILARAAMPLILRLKWLQDQPIMLFLACMLFFLVSFQLLEYGTFAILFAGMGYIVRHQLKRWDHLLFYAATTIFYIAAQYLWFEFSIAQSIVHAALVVGMSIGLYFFNHTRPVMELPAPVNSIVMLGSRYSLYYYILHKTILQIIAAALFMEGSKQLYHWFE